ncbi:hypothetical protein Hanom_Chr05g00386111 [Helianthus anomalus]
MISSYSYHIVIHKIFVEIFFFFMMKDLNKELTHKLEVQTQRLELLIILLTPMKVTRLWKEF